MYVYYIPPYTSLSYSKTGVCRGIPIFLIFAAKHRLWVLAEAVLTCTLKLCFGNNKKNIIFSAENFICFQLLKPVYCMGVFS